MPSRAGMSWRNSVIPTPLNLYLFVLDDAAHGGDVLGELLALPERAAAHGWGNALFRTCVDHLERQVIVLCEHGYSSLLAAVMLARLGYIRACDVVGGFEAWRKAELPTRQGAAASAAPDEPAGLGGPD